jgi:valyl-tRNA synthetase
MGDVQGGIVMGRGTPNEHRSAGLVQAAIDAAQDGRVTFHPERYGKTYLDWLSEKRDWPISRQLWWGHRIPVWAKKGAWGALDLTGLDRALAANAGRAVARLHGLEGGTSALLGADGMADGPEPATGESCAVDVCLLEDDPALVAAFEALGFERDPDVLDTWFSSALWPFSTLGWPDPATATSDAGQTPLGPTSDGGNGRPDALEFFYPGSCLVTGRDIITLWVARMVLAGLYCVGDVPFSDVFIHANILDGKGERMSKSKGNGIDPVDIIEAYGTDAMRYVLCDMQTGSQDIRLPVTAVCPACGHHNDLSEAKTGRSVFIRHCVKCHAEFDILGTIEGMPRGKLISERFDIGRAFCTKLWNSVRFALMALSGGASGPGGDAPAQADAGAPPLTRAALALEDRWILDGLDATVRAVHQGLADYNPSAAIGAARDFFWSALCDWYLELIKPRLADPTSDTARTARRVLAYAVDQVLRLFHPFVPFITEHLWQKLNDLVPERGLGALAAAPPAAQLIAAAWPQPNDRLAEPALRATFADLQEITRAVREVRAAAGVGPKAPLTLTVKPPVERRAALEARFHVVQHLAGVETVTFDPAATRRPGSAAKVVGDLELFVHDVIDDAAERARLEQRRGKIVKEIEGAQKRLGNPSFVERAPAEVVQELRERLAGFQASLDALDRSLAQLG